MRLGRNWRLSRIYCRIWAALYTIFLMSTVSPARSQPTAVYEIDDYLDPRILGATLEDGEIVPGNRFWVAELLAGTISDFEHLGSFTDGFTEFAHLSTSLYLGRHQLNFLVTDFDPRELSTRGSFEEDFLPLERARFVPDYRVRLQYGWYRLLEDTQGDDSIARILFSVGYEEGPFGGIYDLGLVFDIPVDDQFVGSLGYDWRIVEDGFDQHRILYFYSWKNDRWKHFTAPVRLSFGGERTESHWRWAPIRLEAGLRLKIRPLRAALHITYAPTYRPKSRGFEPGFNHELGVFLDLTFVSKLFRR